MSVHGEPEHRTVSDERPPVLQRVDPILIGELALNARENTVGADRHERCHLVGSGSSGEAKAAIQITVPEPQAIVGFEFGHDLLHENRKVSGIEHRKNLEAIQLLHGDVERTFYAWPAWKMRPRYVAALGMRLVAGAKMQ